MKKYSIIYADPPWAYRTYSKKGQGRSAESHYPTMCIEDIKALPVGELAAKDCALFLWITFPCLCEALEVLTAWGFSYKTVAFVWVKQNRRNDDLFTGMGYWTRANAEICILATKGHPKRVDAGVRQVILSHIEEHSKKPDEARERIVRLMGDLPRVELFARPIRRRAGISSGESCKSASIVKTTSPRASAKPQYTPPSGKTRRRQKNAPSSEARPAA